MNLADQNREYDNTLAPHLMNFAERIGYDGIGSAVGTGGRVEWLWGPCACPGSGAIRLPDQL